jgi:polar amino acid transport system substrate-binding protein
MKRLAALAVLGALVMAACGDDDGDAADTVAPTAAPVATGDLPVTSADVPTTGDVPIASSDVPGAGSAAAECAAGKTLAEGALTIATGDPAFPPYVIDDAPETGQGFEAAVALAVAEQMGFSGDAVTWVRTGFDAAIAPGEKDFDFNLQQFSINPEREQTVSFSTPYYTANQAVLGYADGPAAGVTKLSDLKSLKLGAAAATTSLSFITEVIQPDAEPFAFNSNADAKTALDNQQIDAIITDLPTGLYITGVEIEGTQVFGQFPIDAGGAGETWGLLFSKDNPLVECANLALAALTDSGELAAIQDQWMGEYTEAPTLGSD